MFVFWDIQLTLESCVSLGSALSSYSSGKVAGKSRKIALCIYYSFLANRLHLKNILNNLLMYWQICVTNFHGENVTLHCDSFTSY